MNEAPDLRAHARDLAIVRDVRGLYVGMLNVAEMEAFQRLCAAGLAYRSLQGASGFLGLPRVAVQGDLFRE